MQIILARFSEKNREILYCKIFKNSKCLNLSALGNGNARNNDFGYDEIRNLLSDRFVFSHGADIVRLIRASHVACNQAR
jgi:hypothetical protein